MPPYWVYAPRHGFRESICGQRWARAVSPPGGFGRRTRHAVDGTALQVPDGVHAGRNPRRDAPAAEPRNRADDLRAECLPQWRRPARPRAGRLAHQHLGHFALALAATVWLS